ncbi:hypothetical protein F383_02423 [Gossypium arboreum]|uniref:Uncharacterized protein n=1 Tax=Gossypium arboreum TaxID=29729 RepID=A0A0B0P4R4_GOSAR|nr:hypothetical protein F383_02423 [Gossypium arboreum]
MPTSQTWSYTQLHIDITYTSMCQL